MATASPTWPPHRLLKALPPGRVCAATPDQSATRTPTTHQNLGVAICLHSKALWPAATALAMAAAASAGPMPPAGKPPFGVVASMNISASDPKYASSKKKKERFEQWLRDLLQYLFEARCAWATCLCCNARPNHHHLSTAQPALAHHMAVISPSPSHCHRTATTSSPRCHASPGQCRHARPSCHHHAITWPPPCHHIASTLQIWRPSRAWSLACRR